MADSPCDIQTPPRPATGSSHDISAAPYNTEPVSQPSGEGAKPQHESNARQPSGNSPTAGGDGRTYRGAHSMPADGDVSAGSDSPPDSAPTSPPPAAADAQSPACAAAGSPQHDGQLPQEAAGTSSAALPEGPAAAEPAPGSPVIAANGPGLGVQLPSGVGAGVQPAATTEAATPSLLPQTGARTDEAVGVPDLTISSATPTRPTERAPADLTAQDFAGPVAGQAAKSGLLTPEQPLQTSPATPDAGCASPAAAW